MRTIIDLPQRHIVALQYICKQQGASRAEMIRRAIDDFLEKQATNTQQNAFGLWKGRDIDGLSLQQQLRDEWE